MMMKKTNFIWAIVLTSFVLCETGLCQSQSEYALIRRPVFINPEIWKLTKSVAWDEWGTQLFVDQVSVAQGYFMDHTSYLYSAVSFHLDNGWNRVLYTEFLDNWIKAYGERGSGTNQFLWPKRLDCIAPLYEDCADVYYYIYVADASNDRIVKLKYRWYGSSEPDYQIITWDGTISGGGLDLPHDLDINDGGTFLPISDNYLWVLNGHEIKRFTLDGVLRKTYGSFGCDGGLGHFCRPTAVACGRDPFADEVGASDNHIYVADDGNHRIVWLRKSASGDTVSWLKELYYDEDAHIVDLEVDNSGQVWAVDEFNARIYKYTSDLYPLCYFGSFGTGDNQFYYPHSFSYTGGYLDAGDVFVADSWTDSSGGQYFAIGTDVLDFEVASSVDYRWHYINYTLADPSHVTIKVYNQADQLVKTLFGALEYSGACTHVWDGTNDAGEGVLPGDYRIVLIDSSGYRYFQTQEPVNVVTKEAWVHDQGSFGIAPWNLVANQTGADQVTLEWEYYMDRTPWDAFTVYCDGCLCGRTPRAAWTYTDSGLTPGRSYVYWVKAWDPTDPWESPPSNADTVTLSASGAFAPPPELPITKDASPLPAIRYDTDTCNLAIEYTLGYPGHFAEIELLLRNPLKVCGFNLLIKLRNCTYSDPGLANFPAVNMCQDSILIESDWVDYPVRECFIDTTGTLISEFNSLSCRGQVGDTTEPDCNYLWVQGWANPDNCIPQSASYRPLFKFGVDVSCICDADTMRSVLFDIPFGYLVHDYGQCTPFQYYPPAELFAWWSLPGDANNDSVVDAADVLFLTNYLFLGTSPPCIIEAGDPDSSCDISVGDIIYLGNYLFMGSAAPKRGCVPCPDSKEEKQASILSK